MAATRASLFTKLFRRTPKTIHTPKPPARTQLGLTTLEARDVPAIPSGGSLVITGTPGPDTVTVSHTIPASIWEVSKVQVVENGRVQLFSRVSIHTGKVYFNGNAGNDTLQNSAYLSVVADGGTGMDMLSGGPENDTLSGGAGNEHDAIYGNGGNDTISGGGGTDEIRGGGGDDILAGDGDNDTMRGGPGNDTLYGNEGHDIMYGDNNAGIAGGTGDDVLYGAGGNDVLYGEGGNDYLRGEMDSDSLHGNDGNDTLYGDNAGNPWGGETTDYLYGENGNDTLYGEGGKDWLWGGADNDGLFAGLGDAVEILSGGTGADRFLTLAGEDYIEDLTGTDARISFFNSAAQSNLVMAGQTGTFSFAAGSWRNSDVERVDAALGNLHRHVGNTRLLKTAAAGEMSFEAVGMRTAGNANVKGWNNGTRITYVDLPGTATDELQRTVYHEFGHNWDELDENPYAAGFRAVSGWQPHDNGGGSLFPPHGYRLSTDGTWDYLASAAGTFASGYGMTNPHEDMGTTWEAYFVNLYHGGATGLAAASLTANAEKCATLDSLFGDLSQTP